MAGLSAIYVGCCMVLIAVSIGIALFLGAGLSMPESMIIAIAALTALALYDAIAKQLRSRAIVGEQIGNLSRGMADLAHQVGDLARQIAELRRRLTAAEQRTDPAAEKASAAIPAFAAEIDELGLIVHQLAETVAAQQSTIAEQYARMKAATQTAVPATEVSPPSTEAAPAKDTPRSEAAAQPAAEPAAKTPSRKDRIAVIRGILDADRADLYLQPIVSLPQRRLRYYETFTRLRNEDGTLLMPDEFLAVAEGGGLMPRIDHVVLARAVMIARRLLSKNRDIGLVCNISTRTLSDSQSAQQLLQLFDANQELVSTVVLELPQSFWRASGPLAQKTLGALTKLGVRFSMDHVGDLRMEPRELADRGIRLMKVPAKLILKIGETRSTDIHPADLSNLMARYGIGLVAEQIEEESTVADLLDLEVRFGQGYLFSPPRPVRAEVLAEPAAEAPASSSEAQREEAPARQSAPAVERARRKGMLPATGGSRA